MSADELAGCEQDPLPRLGHSLIRRAFDDVETLEVNPEGVSWIGYFSVRESIRDQQMSKFVLDGGAGNGRNGNDRQARSESGYADQQHG